MSYCLYFCNNDFLYVTEEIGLILFFSLIISFWDGKKVLIKIAYYVYVATGRMIKFI